MMPMPCSAEIEPPYFSTTSNTTCSRRASARGTRPCRLDRLRDVVVDVAVAEMAERQRPAPG
jgi:hypothetical protein